MTSTAPTRQTRLATVLLVLVTAIWGSTFFLIRDLLEHVPTTDFLSVRFSIAAVVMLLVFRRQTLALRSRDLRLGLALGAVYGVAQVLQTTGLETTDASVSGFITGTYVVLTPVLAAVILRERIGPPTWAAVALATVGLAILSLRGLSIGTGEAVTLASAVLYAAHIVALGRWSTPQTAVGLAAVQATAIAIITSAAALPDGLILPQGSTQWASLLYMAIVAGAAALWAQTWAQAHLTATRAAIVMALEPVFAALFAVALGGETLTGRMLFGGALVVAAMYLVELAPRAGSGANALEDPPAEALHHDV